MFAHSNKSGFGLDKTRLVSDVDGSDEEMIKDMKALDLLSSNLQKLMLGATL